MPLVRHQQKDENDSAADFNQELASQFLQVSHISPPTSHLYF